jgi:hypothetical protein
MSDNFVPLTPEQRRKLVEAPLPGELGYGINIIPSNCRYGGGYATQSMVDPHGLRAHGRRHPALIPELENHRPAGDH